MLPGHACSGIIYNRCVCPTNLMKSKGIALLFAAPGIRFRNGDRSGAEAVVEFSSEMLEAPQRPRVCVSQGDHQ